MAKTGSLYIVATPIGNLEDITLRALRILREVDLVAAEDTRHSRILLQHYEISTPLISVHNFNETKRATELLTRLQNGKNIALISDAGTPLISDPGYFLVQTLREAGISVTPIPGACAAIAALSAAGLPLEHFIFEGFLPAKSNDRKKHLQALQDETRTLVFYEAPHRILDCCQDIAEIFGMERKMVLAKELTKTFETFSSGSVADNLAWLQADSVHQKGEFVILLNGAEPKITLELSSETQRILSILVAELPAKQAAMLAANITGEKKNRLYSALLASKKTCP